MQSASPLFADWQRLAAHGLTNRAIAARLEVSEAELIASGCGSGCTRLVPDAARLFEAVRAIGTIKVVVRNDYAVMERIGSVRRVRCDGATLDVGGSSFGLTLDSRRLGSIFALNEERHGRVKRSLALYDLGGTSIVKLVLQDGADVDACERLCALLQHAEQAAYRPAAPLKCVVAVARNRGGPASLAEFLASASACGTPLEITLRNNTARLKVQSALHRIKRSERAPWINVLDRTLDLHLSEAEILLLAVQRHGGKRALHWLTSRGEEAFAVTVSDEVGHLPGAREALPGDGFEHVNGPVLGPSDGPSGL